MRILLLHNRYRSEGGEERVVADLQALLAARGHTVALIERRSAGVRGVTAARGLVNGGIDPDEVTQTARALRADVVHAHNLHPLFGWRALAGARAAGARTVLHLHNFRLFCAIGVAYRAGAPCFRCRGTNTLPGLRLNCRGSIGEAAAYAVGLHRQQAHLFEHADRLVAVSGATLRQLLKLGMPGERTGVLPNFVRPSGFASRSRAGEGRYALVSGRLVEEKGFDTAVAAARAAGVPLVVAGEGPDAPRLRALAAGGDVRFAGWVKPDELAQLRARAGVVLVPSRSDEACPYSALDALAAGVPVLASDRGGLPELVGADNVVHAGHTELWSARLTALFRDASARQTAGDQALETARARFSEDTYYERLLEIYGG
jgi:glycosyltransferase involved in cell wall biosynthesis